MKLIVFLQNAWSPLYAGGEWPRRSWLKALERSRSGQRLKHLIDDYSVCHNTTPIVGDNPSSVILPDINHINSILKSEVPDLIIACGSQAEKIIATCWSGALISVPHPAHRLVKNKLYITAKKMIDSGFVGRCSLKQDREFILCSAL